MNVRQKYVELKSIGKLHGSIARAVSIRKKRDANQPAADQPAGKYAQMLAKRVANRSRPVAVPLGDEQAKAWLAKARKDNPRLQEWSSGAIGGESTKAYTIFTSGSNRDWSKKSTFRRGIRVRSTATCADYRVAVLCLGSDTHEIPAPRGYRWDIDGNGLLLRGAAGSYHPTASELVLGGAAVVAALKAAAELRKATKAKAAKEKQIIKTAEAEGATVCLRDSLRAGNCEAGSRTWASRHGFDDRKHYRPSEVLAQANGDASRVALVIAVALRRHRMEMDRGYANLADHR